jgi:hypothetical protein
VVLSAWLVLSLSDSCDNVSEMEVALASSWRSTTRPGSLGALSST